MKWTPPEDTDTEVRRWMRAKGRKVVETAFDYEQGVYTWQGHSTRSGHAPAIRISREVLGSPWYAVLEHLERLRVADAIRRCPDTKYVMVQKGQEVRLEEL